jgi:hypothetical protein
MIVELTDGVTRFFKSDRENIWYVGEVEGNGCLTVYREWDGGVCSGRNAEASFAPGVWRQWFDEKNNAPVLKERSA